MIAPYNYKMIIAYDGTNYSGWQIQPNGTSIQELLQNALKVLIKESVNVIGSGRTDAGVHAMGQVAHFHCHTNLDLYKVLNGINALIPKDIRVKSIEAAPVTFHAQYSAITKTYHYHIHLEHIENPFTRLYSWQLYDKIDLELLRKAASRFIGTHNFTSFANEAHLGSASRDPVRTLQRLDIFEESEGIRLEFQSDGFLYKMVRNIVGTLAEVAAGKRPIEQIAEIFEAKDRRTAGQAAPPQGLFLVKVEYPQ